MRVLHTIPGLSISSGGPTTCTYNLLKGLQDNNIEADVLTLAPKCRNERIIGSDTFIKCVNNDALSPLLFSSNFNQFLKKNLNYDLYHANALWTMPSHMTIKTALTNNKPVVLAPHGMLYPQALEVSKWKKDIIYRVFQKQDLHNVNCIQATCMAEVNHIRNLNIKTPIAIIPNCLDLNLDRKIRIKENNIRTFCFIGRLHPIKNIDYLLKSWSKLNTYTKDCRLVIVGSGELEYEESLKSYVENHHLKNVTFTGFLDPKSINKILSEIDYLVLPSKSENFGMVVPEALNNGVPVLASAGTPWEELNKYNCGWWYQNSELCETLIKAIDLPENIRQQMGVAGKTLVEQKYSTQKIILKMKQLYKWMLNKERNYDFIID